MQEKRLEEVTLTIQSSNGESSRECNDNEIEDVRVASFPLPSSRRRQLPVTKGRRYQVDVVE